MLPRDAPPLLILSDVHINSDRSEATARDLAGLLGQSAGYEVILAGDVFDLSLDPPRQDPAESVIGLLRLPQHARLFEALRAHLAGGGRMSLVAGNHDAALADERVRSALLAALGVQRDARLDVYPWFMRRGGVHVEHGHLYDPDNAPSHPLALWSHATEPLGIALTRRFLAPTGALQLAHAHETTPLGGLQRAYELFGARAPMVVARYFATAIRLCLEAGRQSELLLEQELGQTALSDYAQLTGVPEGVLAELVSAGAEPTHHRFSNTFMRLYFDRVVATLSLAVGAGALVMRRSAAGGALAALSGTYLSRSVGRGKSRYSGVIEQRLRDAAQHVAEKTNAELVIFGHTHREDDAPRYMNSGSFSYTRTDGRPYIVIEHGQPPARRHTA